MIEPGAPSTTVVWRALDGTEVRACWPARAGAPPRTLGAVDDTLTADDALRRLRAGEGLVWEGDHHNARQLLAAVARRIDRPRSRRTAPGAPPGPAAGAGHPEEEEPAEVAARFHRHRARTGERTRTLGRLLVVADPGYRLRTGRAPAVAEACAAAWGPSGDEPQLIGLRDLTGAVGAYEWQRRGIDVPAAGGRLHPRYGVFAPVRAEYVDLVASAPLPGTGLAVDVGTGTGVLAAVLARRGLRRVVATDISPVAVECATQNLLTLGLVPPCEVVTADLFPPGVSAADVVVCNPPWLPGKAASLLERAVYDPDSTMLRTFLAGVGPILGERGEAWLILSDLAERLGLRSRADLHDWFGQGGLVVKDRLQTRPSHRRSTDPSDPFHRQRNSEITTLWRLGHR